MKSYQFLIKKVFLPVSLLLFAMSCHSSSSEAEIKKPNVSGQFFDSNPQKLSAMIDHYMEQADVKPYEQKVNVLIVPHAGYVYSGPVAAYGYKAVSRQKYSTAIILAPSHYVSYDGVSVGLFEGYQTPLGVAEVDQDLAKQIIAQDQKFYFAPEAFAQEHSAEVEIPFLQKTFPGIKIVPIIMGQCSFSTVQSLARTLQKIIGQREDILIVVSSDMSHYHKSTEAEKMDRMTLKAIKDMDVDKIWDGGRMRTLELCGYVPVVTALLYAKAQGLNQVDVLRYAHSGDVTGDLSRVVGYSSTVISRSQDSKKTEAKLKNQSLSDKSSLSLEQKKQLLGLARKTIEQYVKTGKAYETEITDPRLLEEEGAFVTIHNKGQLRGCIGNIIGRGPLCVTVRNMAIAAASKDHRFRPVSKEELNQIDIEISVLSKPRRIENVDDIKMGVHGVIVTQGLFHSGVFLPQVATETGWTKEKFLSELCSQKANLPPLCWKDPKTQIEIFTADVFSEKEINP